MMNTDRLMYAIGAAVIAGVLGMTAFNFVRDPLAARRTWLAEELARVPKEPQTGNSTGGSYDTWLNGITKKPALWTELVPPPIVKPPPPPEKKCKPMSEVLKGVKAGRAQVGKKVKIISPGKDKGEFLGVGDTVSNCVIEDITKDSVRVKYHCAEKNIDLTWELPRE